MAAFQRQHGRLPKATAESHGQPLLPGERPLGLWCTEQQRRKAGSKGPPLTVQEQAALLAIPSWGWWATKPVTKPWEQRRQEVEAFYQQHGRLPRSAGGKTNPFLPGEKELGNWVDRQRQRHKGNLQPPLSAEHTAALEATEGWIWEDYVAWEARCQQVQDFMHQHGRLPREKGSERSPLLLGEKELGKWCYTQRLRRKGKSHQPPLTAEQQAALAALPGWYWDVENDRWEQQLQKLEAFVRVHGRMPRRLQTEKEPLLEGERQLAYWFQRQRGRELGTGSFAPLSVRQQAALKATPFWGTIGGP